MAQVIAIANGKGGCGKTSTAVNLSYALALARRRVLLVDLDPKANSTVALGQTRSDDAHSLAGVLISDNSLQEIIEHVPRGLCDLIAANEDLTAVPVALYNEEGGERKFDRVLKTVSERYDFVILDCPPDLGLLTRSALCAASYLIVPTTCDYLALDALGQILSLFNECKEKSLSKLKLLGVLRTLYDGLHEQSQAISFELKKQFGELLFDSIIPYSQRIAESAASGHPVIFYDKSSEGARAYLQFAGEFLKRLPR